MVLMGIAVIGCPRSLARGVWPMDIPLQNLGAAIIVGAAFLASRLFRESPQRAALPWPAQLLVVVILYSLAVGVLHSGSPTFFWYFFAREGVWLAVCVAGILVASALPSGGETVLILEMCGIGAVLLLIFSVALRLDFLGPPEESTGRRLDVALFALATVALCTMPIVARVATREKRRAGVVLALSSLSVVAFGVVSGTRSVLMVWVFAAALSGYFLLRARVISKVTIVGLILICGAAATVLWRVGELQVVTDRFRDPEAMVENIRLTEAREFLERWEEWFPFGAGIGVGFRTVVGVWADAGVTPYDGLVNAPHIGIMAWTIKAGLFGAFFSIVLIAGVLRALKTPRKTLCRTIDCYPGVAVLLAIGSISGGWTMVDLFLTGLFVAVGDRAVRAAEGNRQSGRSGKWNIRGARGDDAARGLR